VRAFVALDLPEPLRVALERVQEDLTVGRPVPAENLHLTLAFLGEQPDAVVEEIHHGLAALALPGFPLRIGGLGTFGGQGVRVLYAGADPSPPLRALHEAVRQAVHRAGLTLPRERFRPHVTLARFGGMLPRGESEKLHAFLATHAWLGIDPAPVDSFALYRSVLRPDGARHEALARYVLS
jgi:2'-5' RNA ligase